MVSDSRAIYAVSVAFFAPTMFIVFFMPDQYVDVKYKRKKAVLKITLKSNAKQ